MSRKLPLASIQGRALAEGQLGSFRLMGSYIWLGHDQALESFDCVSGKVDPSDRV